ncbi:hypothetical protein IAU59_001236 [Kwoniella sp. CBS 9459]
MKASVALIAALAAGISVNANFVSEDLDARGDQEPEIVRILPFQPTEPSQANSHEHVHGHHMLCHGSGSGAKAGSAPASASVPGPLGALLSRLGFSGRPAISMDTDTGMDHPPAVRSSVMKHWKEHVESMISHHHLDSHQAHQDEDHDGAKVLPFLEGGHVRLMPLVALDEDEHGNGHKHWMKGNGHLGDRTPEIKWWRAIGRGRWLVKDNAGEWREPRIDEMPPRRGRGSGEHHDHHHHHAYEGGMAMTKEGEDAEGLEHKHRHGHVHHGHHGHRHRMAKSVAGRLHRALKNLRPAESIAMAFIIGAGLGSILHFVFMLFLLSIRRFRSGAGSPSRSRIALRGAEGEDLTWEEARRARKIARKEARKARKAERKAQRELLPAYEEGEGARLVVEEKVEQEEA